MTAAAAAAPDVEPLSPPLLQYHLGCKVVVAAVDATLAALPGSGLGLARGSTGWMSPVTPGEKAAEAESTAVSGLRPCAAGGWRLAAGRPQGGRGEGAAALDGYPGLLAGVEQVQLFYWCLF